LRTSTGFVIALLSLSLFIGGCGSSKSTTRSSSQYSGSPGNPPFYEVYGERYYVMESSAGYEERGVASWYGKKFHGRKTSNGEVYDMYAMTAAHKTLPLPATVRVTNLRNGRNVVVRVNDRGPFVDNRLIDLSYAAAKKLDMITAGTTLVEVEVLDSGGTSRTSVAAAGTGALPPEQAFGSIYMQVGAFGEQGNAESLRRRLRSDGLNNVLIVSDKAEWPTLYRVRIGPIDDVAEYDQLIQRVRNLQIVETQLVIEPQSS
jgi:rare lipoprotein A